MEQTLPRELDLYFRLGLVPIPLKPRAKKALVKWGDGWNPAPDVLGHWLAKPKPNWGLRCDENLAVIDCDSEGKYLNFVATYKLPTDCPLVKTGRGYHIWVKSKKPIRSQRVDSIEIKCLGSYIVASPSIHPSGVQYSFQVVLNGALPEVDLEALFGLPSGDNESNKHSTSDFSIPSEFALCYGKSPYPQTLCGLATKVFTRPDGKVKKLLSLRCWKWDCPKCAPLLKRYWMDQLSRIPFRFIYKLPTVDKPTAFLRRVGKPGYTHIVSNGEAWLFLASGDTERVWSEAKRAGYELIAGDISGDPTPEEIAKYLEQALCREEEPLNTRRKITHSRNLFTNISRNGNLNESKQKSECKEKEDMSQPSDEEQPKWNSEVVMSPINQVAKEYEAKGWRILWKSEVEVIAIKDDDTLRRDMDIVETMNALDAMMKQMMRPSAN